MTDQDNLQPMLELLAPKWSQPLTGPGSRPLSEWLRHERVRENNRVDVTGWSVAKLVQWCTDHGLPLDVITVGYGGCGSHAVVLAPSADAVNQEACKCQLPDLMQMGNPVSYPHGMTWTCPACGEESVLVREGPLAMPTWRRSADA